MIVIPGVLSIKVGAGLSPRSAEHRPGKFLNSLNQNLAIARAHELRESHEFKERHHQTLGLMVIGRVRTVWVASRLPFASFA